MRELRRAFLGAVCVGLLALAGASPVSAAAPEPDFILTPPPPPPQPPEPPPAGYLYSPCGLAVDNTGRFYVSDYYHHAVDVFSSSGSYITQIANVDPLDGPCGLAVDSAGRIYVNNYHRNVERFTPSSVPPGGSTTFGAPTLIDSSHPTGVAVDPLTGNVYVNARTHIAAYDSTGAPLLDGGDLLQIGEGSLGDGYGIAVSRFGATAGRLYVPDWDDDTVKVYDPATDTEDPVQVIDGADTPLGGFGSLRDSAVAVDRITGEVYVADTLAYPQYTERPQAIIRVFEHTGSYKGRLKYPVIDSSPPGLAVDNTLNPTQGRVYVTSGNTTNASVYAYPPGSATNVAETSAFSALPGSPPGLSDGPLASAAEGTADGDARAAASVISQKGKLRVTVSGGLAPKRLPRKGTAPVSVSVGGEISTTDKSPPPQLKSLLIELHQGGRLDSAGLPKCVYARIQPGSSSRALSACRDALVGTGSFSADITLSGGQEPYPTSGKLLIFNGAKGGKPVLFGHLYSRSPFASSFVIVFELRKLGGGTYGTALSADLPEALGNWGNLTGLEMTLQRRYSYRGQSHSYISAGCPAPKGFTQAIFPLARTSFAFAGGAKLTSTLTSTCRARG